MYGVDTLVLISFLLGVGLTHFKSSKAIILGNAAYCILMAVYMWVQGAYSGMAINIVVIIWTCLLFHPKIRKVTDSTGGLYGLIFLMVLMNIVFSFHALVDIFPVLAFIIGRLGEGRCKDTPQALRKYYAAAEVCWLAYGLSIGIWAACLKTLMGLCSVSVAIYLYSRHSKRSAV
tara:strand:- start:975 stop:1499 length:525 start_codon:yes stop_codon:yes gene_type:complete